MVHLVMAIQDLAIWLREYLETTGLSQAELARKSHLSPSQISRILNMTSTPSQDALVAIAKAVNISPEEVFRIAGVLPVKRDEDQLTAEVEYLLSQLPDYKRRQAIAFIRFLAEHKGDDFNAANQPLGEVK